MLEALERRELIGRRSRKPSAQKRDLDDESESKSEEEVPLEDELDNLIEIHKETTREIHTGLSELRKNIEVYQEPEAVTVLEKKIDKEREYIQNQIINMEIKQIAESIT